MPPAVLHAGGRISKVVLTAQLVGDARGRGSEVAGGAYSEVGIWIGSALGPQALLLHESGGLLAGGGFSRLGDTVKQIWGRWLPASPHRHVPRPDFEQYDARWDPQTGLGEIDVWVPIADA